MIQYTYVDIYIYIKPRHLFVQKLYFGFFKTLKDSIFVIKVGKIGY